MVTNTTRPRFHIATYGKFVAIFALVLALYHWSGVELSGGPGALDRLLVPIWTALAVSLSLLRPKRQPVDCSACGRRCHPFTRRTPALCPTCRVATLSPEQSRRSTLHGFALLIGLFVALGAVLAWPFAEVFAGRFGGEYALGFAVLAAVLSAGSFVVFAGALVIAHLAGMRRLGRPGRALATARKLGGKPVLESSLGLSSVHAFAAADPRPLLEEAKETTRRRFEALVGEPLGPERPLRILVFGRRDAFQRFLLRGGLNAGSHDGLYVPWSERTVVVTTEEAPHSLMDLSRTFRSLFGYAELEAFQPRATPTWLQIGVANVVAVGGDEAELARLHRRLLASFARGRVLGSAELFLAKPWPLIRLVRQWDRFEPYARLSQFYAQSWSVAEFLCGADASPERRARFVAFLKDLGPREPQEATFARHFGHGFDPLLEEWRNWVAARGAGPLPEPAPEIREAAWGRVLPIARDRNAAPLDRIRAIRELARAGDVAIAGPLIELLRAGEPVLRPEIVGTLEALSGTAPGLEPSAWQSWWRSQPEGAVSRARVAQAV